jgi:Na+(H+)/acetate symporter ActP
VKQEINIVRIVSILVVIVGIMVAYIIPNIREGFIYLWQFCLFACFPFWCGIVWRRGTSLGAWASNIGAFCIWLIIELKMKNGLMGEGYVFMANQFLVCIPTGFLLYIIFSYLSKPEESTKLENFYRRLRTPVGSDTEIDKH